MTAPEACSGAFPEADHGQLSVAEFEEFQEVQQIGMEYIWGNDLANPK